MAWWNKVFSAAKAAVSKAVKAVAKVVKTVVKTVSNTVKKAVTTVKKVVKTVSKSVSNTVRNVAPAVKAVAKAAAPVVVRTIAKVAEKVVDATINIKKNAERAAERARAERERAEAKAEEERIKRELEEEVRKALEEEKGAVIDEEKMVFWEKKGHGTADAIKISRWVRENKMTPAPDTITKIIKEKLETGEKKEWYETEKKPLLTHFGIPLLDPLIKAAKKIPAAWDKLTRGILSKTKFAKFVKSIPGTQYLSLMVYGEDLEGKKRKPTAKEAGSFWATLAGVGATAGILSGAAFGISAVWGASALTVTPAATQASGLPAWVIEKIGSKPTTWGSIVQVMSNLVTSMKANPLITIFALTEFPQLAVMSVFAFKWLAQQKGLDLTSVSISLGNLYKAFEGAGYEFRDAVKKNDMTTANLLYLRMKDLSIEYNETVERKKDVLEKAGELEGRQIMGDLMNTIIEKMETEIGFKMGEMPEEFEATVRDIIDGDTLDLGLEGTYKGSIIRLPEYKTSGHARVRVVGINSPEKSPKGEIVCTDVEIFKVEKKFADEARDRLLPLNDKKVIVKTDKTNFMDSYGRILAVIEHEGKDIGLRLIKEGLACRYFRTPHKWVNEDEYKAETLKAKEEGVGMWEGLEEVEKEEDKIKIYITSTPANAKLYLDNVALRHNTPSDEAELSDVIHLFTLGPHILSAEKAGMSAMKDIEIVKGDNGTIELTLESAPVAELPPVEEVAPPEEVPVEVPVEVPPEEIPPEEIPPEIIPPALLEYSESQKWALKEAMQKIWDLTKGAEVMSEVERETLIAGFGMYSEEQKEALLPLWIDLEVLTKGREALSTDEFNNLKIKYQVKLEV